MIGPTFFFLAADGELYSTIDIQPGIYICILKREEYCVLHRSKKKKTTSRALAV